MVTSLGMYVGRVGGLAVALGIGAAIATGQGVASADSPGPLRVPGTLAKLLGHRRRRPGRGIAGRFRSNSKRFSVPSTRPWGRQAHAVPGRQDRFVSRQSETCPLTPRPHPRNGRLPNRSHEKPLHAAAATPGLGTGTPTGGESTASDEAGEEHTVADDPAVMPEGRSETSHGAAAILTQPSVARRLPSRHSTPDAVERWRSQHELDGATARHGRIGLTARCLARMDNARIGTVDLH